MAVSIANSPGSAFQWSASACVQTTASSRRTPSAGCPAGALVSRVKRVLRAKGCCWLGWPLADDMDGQVADFLERSRRGGAETVATYDGRPIERLRDVTGTSDEPVLEQLRALGYIE